LVYLDHLCAEALTNEFIKSQVDSKRIPPNDLYSQENIASMLKNYDLLNKDAKSTKDIDSYALRKKIILGDFIFFTVQPLYII
jgi:hypothetical protein